MNDTTIIQPGAITARKVKLGPLTVSQVCFGTEHINRSTPEYGGDILADAARLHGVFFWDTDNAYGSHTQVAAGLTKLPREQVVVCSKTYGHTRQEAQHDLERTLKELGTTYIDIFLLHEVAAGSLAEKMPALDYLLEAKARGQIRAVGLSTHCAGIISAAAEIAALEIVCAPFNREGSRIEEGSLSDMETALKKAHACGKGVYIIKVLGKGELTYDIRGALEWAMARHEFIDVYNLGVANLSELRQNLQTVNAYFDACREDKR